MATKEGGETTSKRVASIASKQLRDKNSTGPMKATAASALTQAANKKKPPRKGG